MSARAADRDLAAAAVVAALAALPFAPAWSAGLFPYYGDLTYLQQPWHGFDAQLLQAGRLPSWNPYVYFGMPQAAAMQDALFYPLSALFSLFSFPAAAEAFATLHAALAGWLTFLWLRSAGARRAGALLGACAVALGGIALENRQFLNHLSSLAFVPALLLLGGRPAPLALALGLGLVAGYPPIIAGGVVLAWLLALALGGRPRAGTWAKAALAAAAAGACLLLPAVELALLSRRAAGVGLDEALLRHFTPGDLAQWLGPLAAGFSRYDPSGRWWVTCHIGLAAAAAAGLGLRRAGARRGCALAALVAGALLLTLGPSTPLSRGAWALLPPLRLLRYPGNLSYLALWPLALLAALGVSRRARVLAALAAAELTWYAWGRLPVAPPVLAAGRGALVERLQMELAGGERFLASPKVLFYDRGASPAEWYQRLYGETSALFRLRAASNFGEPLVPRASFEAMSALLSAKDAAAAAALFPAVGVRVLLTPGPAQGAGLSPAGSALWTLSRWTGPSALAYFSAVEPPDELLPRAPGEPLAERRDREDRFEVSGDSPEPGWAYVAEPLYPGWEVFLDDGSGPRAVIARRAMTAFQKLPVPAGRWSLTFRYDPESGRAGRALSLAALALLAGLLAPALLRWPNASKTS